MGFSFGERTNSVEGSALTKDLEANKLHAIEVCSRDRVLPKGMKLFVSDKYFGVTYTHPHDAYGHATGAAVKFNQSKEAFITEADKECNKVYQFAKKTNAQSQLLAEKSNRVKECETMMVDGKCPCGYCYKAPETASVIRSMVGSYVHRGVYVKNEPEEDDEVLW